MAKKSSGPSKSQAIRDYFDAHPKAKPKQVAEALGQQGIDVSAQFVSTVRSNAKRKKTKRRGRPAAGASAKRTARGAGRATKRGAETEVSIDSLVRVKKIVEEMGGVSDARRALDALSKLMD